MTSFDESDYGSITFHSDDSPLVELSDQDWPASALSAADVPRTSEYYLAWMRMRVSEYGSPLPVGFVSPPGIDIADLLRQLPWPPTA